jgi:hypothetical protein
MKKTRKSPAPVPADAIARLADAGKDVSRFFKGEGRMVQPIRPAPGQHYIAEHPRRPEPAT